MSSLHCGRYRRFLTVFALLTRPASGSFAATARRPREPGRRHQRRWRQDPAAVQPGGDQLVHPVRDEEIQTRHQIRLRVATGSGRNPAGDPARPQSGGGEIGIVFWIDTREGAERRREAGRHLAVAGLGRRGGSAPTRPSRSRDLKGKKIGVNSRNNLDWWSCGPWPSGISGSTSKGGRRCTRAGEAAAGPDGPGQLDASNV